MNRYMSATAALKYGLIDKIIPTSKKQPELLKKEIDKLLIEESDSD
jgi:hypothetical protein